jgi:hypothetical protein
VNDYLQVLARRLERVRITCGDWTRVLKPSVLRATATNSHIGVLLDPPYSVSGNLYAATNTGEEHTSIPEQVQQWCVENPGYRIVLCGFDDDHDALLEHGWGKEVGRSGGGAGYNTDSKAGRRERLWLSPPCISSQHALDFGTGA